MEEVKRNNYALLRGEVCEAPRYSHESRGEQFYQFSLAVSRLSGATDTIHILARAALLEELELDDGTKLNVLGELRSFNNKSGTGARLVISVFAKELWLSQDEEDENIIELRGTICKMPNLRTTPMGREICDLMIAVNRRYGRSDYLPCIAWGIKAREAACWDVGTVVHLSGRVQSRAYTKNIGGESVEKIAYEVSVINIHADE